LLHPRWLAGHLLVLVLTVAFVALGLWQWGRYQDEQDTKDAARGAFAAPAPDLDETDLTPGTRVQATGRYEAAGEVLLRNRVRNGDGGYDVLTPLALPDGTAVMVDRGWIPRTAVEGEPDDFAPPPGDVTVRGVLGGSRPLDPDDTVDERAGRTTLPRVDLDRIGAEVGTELRGVYITAQAQEPPPGDGLPALPEPPDTDDVNHRSYAFQWFALALIPIVGWPIVLSRARRRGGVAREARTTRA
jgi:cytochrome oxidase assembly protein ShyY1